MSSVKVYAFTSVILIACNTLFNRNVIPTYPGFILPNLSARFLKSTHPLTHILYCCCSLLLSSTQPTPTFSILLKKNISMISTILITEFIFDYLS